MLLTRCSGGAASLLGVIKLVVDELPLRPLTALLIDYADRPTTVVNVGLASPSKY